ncbi:hypothetical protein AnigIFM49718_006257 [Aspergillus niger]|nr:hypothetical protein AnigIFM49718_006257 [Aspergillus niger]
MDIDVTDRYECSVMPVEDDERLYVAKLDEHAPGCTRSGVMCANSDGDRESDLTMKEEGLSRFTLGKTRKLYLDVDELGVETSGRTLPRTWNMSICVE